MYEVGVLSVPNIILVHYLKSSGPGSVVGIATELRAGRSGIESRWGARISAPVQTCLRLTQPPVQWVPGLFRG
jgi:hypothetical protein